MPRSALLLALAVLMAAGGRAQAGSVIPLPTVWQVQPATAPEAPPREGDWVDTPEGWGDWVPAWRWSGRAKGTSWAQTPHDAVNSLWLQQTVDFPAAWQGQRVIVDFPRIEGDAIVFLNGQRMAELLRPGGEVEVTPAARFGEDNVLRVFLTRDYTGISRSYEQDVLRFLASDKAQPPPVKSWSLGIVAPAALMVRPQPAAISGVFVQPSWRQKTLTLEVEINAAGAVEDLSLRGTILDAEGKTALEVSGPAFSAPTGRSVQRISAPWPNPVPWELDGGYRYTAQVSLVRKGVALDTAPAVKFGFREIWTEGREIMMNGHRARWRLVLERGMDPQAHALSFYRLLGYNVLDLTWHPLFNCSPADAVMLEAMDAQGVGALASGVAYHPYRQGLLDDPKVQAEYAREMELFVRRYRNHPSILAWCLGINTFCPLGNIWPTGMGKRIVTAVQAQQINAAVGVAHRVDPTRLAFSHADGGTGDLATSNVYLNFAPLQEREEWPMAWAESGEMPYAAIEFGQPYTANFWKGKRFLLTEYAAMYFGEEAYAREGEAGLRRTGEYSLANTSGHGAIQKVDLADYPMYWEFQRLFVRQTNRAWRTWGVNGGWLYWVLDTGFGDPVADKTFHFGVRYQYLTEPVTEKPAWANPNFDIHRQANEPLLVYLAGAPRHTDKTHAYYAGETIEKQVAAVFDGPGTRELRAEWTLLGGDGKTLDSGTIPIRVSAGDIQLLPFKTTAPSVKARTALALALTVREGEQTVATDRFELQVFPKPAPSKLGGRIALYDPAGKSRPWLETLGVRAAEWRPGQPLEGVDLLIVGREALEPGGRLPYGRATVEGGLRVLILEQRPEMWEALGLRAIETMPRYVFARDRQSPVLEGLQAEDLINWRGTPDLLPEGKLARSGDTQHAPKWTNTHAVASVALQLPATVGFTPLLATEFDMNYSPLLEWRCGRGAIYFCSLDLTGRVGTDPAATILAQNLLKLAATPLAATRPTFYLGEEADKANLAPLRVELRPGLTWTNPEQSVLVLGAGGMYAAPEVARFVQQGGRALVLPQTAEDLRKLGLQTETRQMGRATVPADALFRGVGPSQLRWREPVEIAAFSAEGQPKEAAVLGNGAFLLRREGKGLWLFTQVSPAQLAGRYASLTEADKRQNLDLTRDRQGQLLAQLLTNLGATPSAQQAVRLTTLTAGLQYTTLGPWQVLGPYRVEKEDGELMLGTKFAGEEDAIAGRTEAVGDLQWRPVSPDDTGFVDLTAALGPSELAVGYATLRVSSERKREAVLRLGMDWRLRAWVNGELVFSSVQGRRRDAGYQVRVPLRAGENVITLKIGSGSKGFGFWASLSADPGEDVDLERIKRLSLYSPTAATFDPYEFAYW